LLLASELVDAKEQEQEDEDQEASTDEAVLERVSGVSFPSFLSYLGQDMLLLACGAYRTNFVMAFAVGFYAENTPQFRALLKKTPDTDTAQGPALFVSDAALEDFMLRCFCPAQHRDFRIALKIRPRSALLDRETLRMVLEERVTSTCNPKDIAQVEQLLNGFPSWFSPDADIDLVWTRDGVIEFRGAGQLLAKVPNVESAALALFMTLLDKGTPAGVALRASLIRQAADLKGIQLPQPSPALLGSAASEFLQRRN
jgi:hypothetical protein